MKAIWNNTIIAESDATVVVENNHYFPHDSIKKEYFELSTTQSTCPWKGVASYYTIQLDGKQNQDSAWFYPEVFVKAKAIKNHVAFWKGVDIKP